MDLIDTYKSLCTEFYDLDKPTASKEALEYYLEEVKKSTQPILEPMCGTGRFLIPILEQGFDIEGTDASFDMLESCRKKCKKKNLFPTLYYQRIQDLILPKSYGLIFIPSGSFGLIIENEEMQESLKRLNTCLLSKGRLIIEIETPYLPPKDEKRENRDVSRNDFSKIQLTTATQYNSETKIETINCEYQNVVNNSLTLSETETIRVKHYEVNEFAEQLKSVGFSEIEALRPYSDGKVTGQDNMILFKCVKAG